TLDTLCKIVEEARSNRPSDNSLKYACVYTKTSHELLENVIASKHTCFARDLDGVDLIKGTRGTNLYTISVEDMMRSSPICLLSRDSKNKSWLWHRHLNHLNFGTINDVAQKDLIRGLPRLKFKKDHLYSACQLGKSKKYAHKPKNVNTIMEVLHTLHMDLCGPMRVQSINGKKYILVIVDDYSRFTWVKFLRTKDKTPEVIIKLIKRLQVRLNKPVRNIRTNNGTEFVNRHLIQYYESVGNSHQKSVPRTPQQNGVVEIRNLVEAARTMLIFSKALTQPVPPAPTVHDPVFQPAPPAPAVHVLVSPTGTPTSFSIKEEAPSTSISSSLVQRSPYVHQGVVVDQRSSSVHLS
nr:retrovirus-related Pol polyprotein from transposon TNT 1-94 [Tanacetum cinerariifolium]